MISYKTITEFSNAHPEYSGLAAVEYLRCHSFPPRTPEEALSPPEIAALEAWLEETHYGGPDDPPPAGAPKTAAALPALPPSSMGSTPTRVALPPVSTHSGSDTWGAVASAREQTRESKGPSAAKAGAAQDTSNNTGEPESERATEKPGDKKESEKQRPKGTGDQGAPPLDAAGIRSRVEELRKSAGSAVGVSEAKGGTAVFTLLGWTKTGKTYLNARLQHVTAGASTGQGLRGKRLLRTKRGQPNVMAYSWPAGWKGRKRWNALSIDLPGETFIDATMERGQVDDLLKVALELSDVIVICVAAPDMLQESFRHGKPSRASPNTPPPAPKPSQNHFRDIVKLIETHGGGNPTRHRAIYVAILRADATAKWAEIAENKLTAPAFLGEYAPQLLDALTTSSLLFGCGFVVSFFDIEKSGALEFVVPNRNDATQKRVYDAIISWRTTPSSDPHLLEYSSFVAECWLHWCSYSLPNGELDSLPNVFVDNRELTAHEADVVRFIGNGESSPAFDAVEGALKTLGVSSVNFVAFFETTRDWYGIHDFANAVKRLAVSTHERPDPYLTETALRKNGAIRSGSHVLNKLVLPFRWLRNSAALAIGAAILLLLCFYWVLPSAEDRARQKNEQMSANIEGSLPRNFSVDGRDAWSIPEKEYEKFIGTKDLGAATEFKIHDDLLVGAPDFAAANLITEKGQLFHAFIPGDTPNGRWATRVYNAFKACPERKSSCPTFAQVPAVESSGEDDETKRVFFWAQALHSYTTLTNENGDVVLPKLRLSVDKFEKATQLFTKWAKTNKGEYLPKLATGLLKSHAAFRADMLKTERKPQSMRNYWAAIEGVMRDFEGRKEFSEAELRAIGVDAGVLAMHNVATALAQFRKPNDLRSALKKRLEFFGIRFGDGRPSFTAEQRSSVKRYPALACMTMLIVFPPQPDDVSSEGSEWCSKVEDTNASEPRLLQMLGERALLTSDDVTYKAGQWSKTYNLPFPFHRHLTAVTKAATAQAEQPETSSEDKKKLLKIASTMEATTLQELRSAAGLYRFGLVVLSAFAIGWFVRWFLRRNYALSFMGFPLTKDKYGHDK